MKLFYKMLEGFIETNKILREAKQYISEDFIDSMYLPYELFFCSYREDGLDIVFSFIYEDLSYGEDETPVTTKEELYRVFFAE